MKKNENMVLATLSEARAGKPFTNIEVSTLPAFNESDFSISGDDYRFALIEKIRHVALPSLPTSCSIDNRYDGILATDLFSLNTLLGSMIEGKVVAFLNLHRHLWDDGLWNEYHFIRSKESFPDVRLVKKNNRREIVMGIELKSWFILSKEGEPSFRYRTASEACDTADLICIIPWYLSDAVCGNPILVAPWIYSAKAAAEATKRYWVYERQTEKPMNLEQRRLDSPQGAKPYMDNARDKTNYRPVNDGGNNFGRLARTGIMSSFVADALMTDILGIQADNWRLFLKAHTDSKSLQEIQKKVVSQTETSITKDLDGLFPKWSDLLKLLSDYYS